VQLHIRVNATSSLGALQSQHTGIHDCLETLWLLLVLLLATLEQLSLLMLLLTQLLLLLLLPLLKGRRTCALMLVPP
jgi:hypothetical protein